MAAVARIAALMIALLKLNHRESSDFASGMHGVHDAHNSFDTRLAVEGDHDTSLKFLGHFVSFKS